jgi:hypothetical protein
VRAMEEFVPALDELVTEGLVVVDVQVVPYLGGRG